MGLNIVAMNEALETFQSSVEFVLNKYTPAQRVALWGFLKRLTEQNLPHILVTPEGAVKARDSLFGDAANANFIQLVVFTFISRFGQDEATINSLCENLARGAILCGSNPATDTLSLIPENVQKRLPTYEAASTLLKSNTWLLSLLLIILTVQVDADLGSTGAS